MERENLYCKPKGKPQVVGLTSHFVQRWRERKGGAVNAKMVNAILQRSVCVFPQRVLYQRDGEPYILLGRYWDPVEGLVLVIDEKQGMAVTLLTAANGGSYDEERKRAFAGRT